MTKRSLYWGVLGLLMALVIGVSVSEALQSHRPAASFPERPVTIVVTFPPGGGTDLLARRLGAELEHHWQRPVVIENRPGASGVVGARHVVESAADGHTLLMANSSYAINPSVLKELGFDPSADLTGVMNVAWVPSVLVTGVHATSLDLSQLMKKQTDPTSYASCGNGTPQHLAGEMLQQKTSIRLLHVPYRGCGPALTDVISGQVDLGIVTVSSAMGLIESGLVKPLAVTSTERSPVLANVPTIAEVMQIEFDLNQWHGLLVSSQTPEHYLVQLHEAINKVMGMQKIQDSLQTLGYTSSRSSADEFNQIIAADLQRFAQLVHDAKVKLD